ncbi:MAG: radical SAM protein [Spirochaetales bacterium]|nr:radical SAM protein [Spirochaetales bacterium]
MNEISALYRHCTLCPKDCGIDRLSGQRGYCRMSGDMFIASAVLHRGEEPPLSGLNGSGAIFFSGCTLGCTFCQNIQISCPSGGLMGAGVSADELSEIMLTLENRGAANINLVTATQFTPSVIDALKAARRHGLGIPVAWNSSGYESVETIKSLAGIVDIWLPDLKTLDVGLSGRLFGAPDYPAAAASALKAMAASLVAGGGTFLEDDIMRRGMIMRHLVLPGHVETSIDVLRWYAENLMGTAMLSLMVQYTPVNEAGARIASSGYMISEADYEKLLCALEDFGIDEGFIQEPEAADSKWIPDFSRLNPFPADYSMPVWHWREGHLPKV